MSRGLGKTERAILEHLGNHKPATTTHLIAATSPSSTPTDSHKRSVWRAVRSLHRKGLVETEHRRRESLMKRLKRKQAGRRGGRCGNPFDTVVRLSVNHPATDNSTKEE